MACTSQPTRPRSRATGGRGRAAYGAGTRDSLPSQLERTTSGRARARFTARDTRADVEPPIARARDRAHTADGIIGGCDAGRGRAVRSGRVSGIRPSDRRGPGPAGHRGRNVRSTGRCSYNLRITRRRADSCGLHRSTSQVIRRSGSGVFFRFDKNTTYNIILLLSSFVWTLRSGVVARGRSVVRVRAY